MTVTQRFNKFLLSTHITFSIGWLGAVAVFLALAVTGLNSSTIQISRSAYLAMEMSAWYVIVPFCFASLLTGIIQSLTTKWGLFKHYWIIVKLVLTITATIALLLHMNPIREMAEVAVSSSFSEKTLPNLRIQLIADSGLAILLLFVITTISVYKPWGKIRKGERQEPAMNKAIFKNQMSWKFYLLIGLLSLIALVIIKHLLSGGMSGH